MKNQIRDRPVSHVLRPGALKAALVRASLRVRAMALVAVTSALNAMLRRIEAGYRARDDSESRARDSEDRMRRFVADASHELRTPLTSVRGLADFYFQQGEAAPRAEVTRMMAGIRQEAARMGRLVDDLLLLAHFDVDRPLDLQRVDLASVAAQPGQRRHRARAVHRRDARGRPRRHDHRRHPPGPWRDVRRPAATGGPRLPATPRRVTTCNVTLVGGAAGGRVGMAAWRARWRGTGGTPGCPALTCCAPGS